MRPITNWYRAGPLRYCAVFDSSILIDLSSFSGSKFCAAEAGSLVTSDLTSSKLEFQPSGLSLGPVESVLSVMVDLGELLRKLQLGT